MYIMDLLTVYNFWLFVFDTGSRFLVWEKEQANLTPPQRVCCGAFLSDEPLPEICFEKGVGCPAFDFLPEGGSSKDEGWHVWDSIKLAAMVAARSAVSTICVLAVLLASAVIMPQNIWTDHLEAAERAFRITRQCVAAKLTEMALAFTLRFFLGVHGDGSTCFFNHMYFSCSWGLSMAVAVLVLGTSGLQKVPQLSEGKVYILVEYVYSSVIFPVFLAATGFSSLANMWACLKGVGFPTAVLVFVRAWHRMGRGEEEESYVDRLLFGSGDREDGIGSRWSFPHEQWRYVLRALGA